jgi:tetratricopeptide (TPR) repeat protein/CHAT domain-containing protein
MTFALATLLNVLVLAQAQPADAEAEVRAAVQQYYDAQAQRDPDRTLAFWSTAANPRPTREAFLAVFGPSGEDTFTVDVQAVQFRESDVRVRVLAVRMRLLTTSGGTSFTQRSSFLNSQLWRREAGTWKLLRDGPFADQIADEIIAAPASDRPALYERPRAELVQVRLAISQRATMAITLGRNYVQGKALFELALEVSRAAGDRIGEANSLHNIAQATYFLADYPAAAEAYERELAVGREINDQAVIGGALFGLATVKYSRAEYTPAVALYREALAIYEKQDDGAAIGRAVISIGNVQYLQAEYDAATASYRRALEVLLAAGDPQAATFAKSGLARVFAAQGDIPAALAMYGQVLIDARAALEADARLKSNVAQPLESLGELYYRLGNFEQARAHLEQARTLYGVDASSQGRVSASLGVTELNAGRFEAALAAYTESKSKYEVAKEPDGVARAWVGIGFSHAAREKYGDAIAAYKTAIRMFEAQKENESSGRAWLGLSLAQSGLRDYEAALVSARKVQTIADLVKSVDLGWRASVRTGEVLRKLARLDEARAEFQRAIAAIDRIAAELPINPDARARLDDSAGAWTGLAMTFAASRNPREALDAAEARRAHIRRVQFGGFHRDISRGMSAEELTGEQSLVREIISTRAQLHAENSLKHPDTERLGRLQQQQTTLLARRTDQQAKLYARLPALRDLRGLGAPVAPATAFPLDGDGEVIIEYLVEDDELLAITMRRGEDGPAITATLTPINRREFADQIAQALEPATLADLAAWRPKSAPIAAAVIAPIALNLADARSVIIIPDDVLWRVPFEALPSGEGALGARLRVRYASSIATLVRQRAAAEAAASPAATVTATLLVAPAIPDAVRTQLTLAQSGWKAPDEEGGLARASALAAIYGDAATVRAKADASEETARAALATADVIHLAGPFQASGASPLFSFAVLSGSGDAAAADGRWELREWFQGEGTTTRARVIVVSDGASLGASGSGGVMDALAWASAALGVPSVVIGRWPADAFTTDALLSAFHRELAKGSTVGAAWSAAVTAAAATSPAPSAWTGLRLLGPG